MVTKQGNGLYSLFYEGMGEGVYNLSIEDLHGLVVDINNVFINKEE